MNLQGLESCQISLLVVLFVGYGKYKKSVLHKSKLSLVPAPKNTCPDAVVFSCPRMPTLSQAIHFHSYI